MTSFMVDSRGVWFVPFTQGCLVTRVPVSDFFVFLDQLELETFVSLSTHTALVTQVDGAPFWSGHSSSDTIRIRHCALKPCNLYASDRIVFRK